MVHFEHLCVCVYVQHILMNIFVSMLPAAAIGQNTKVKEIISELVYKFAITLIALRIHTRYRDISISAFDSPNIGL